MDNKNINVGKSRNNIKWTKDEDDYLINHYEATGFEEMMVYLGRSNKAIRSRAGNLGVKRQSRKKTNEKFIKEFYGIFKEEEYILLSEYKSNHEYITYYHATCGKTNKSSASSLLNGHGCICKKYSHSKVDLEDFLDRLVSLGKKQYTLTKKLPYINTTTPVELLHNVCGNVYKTKPMNFFKGRRCPFCAHKGNSKGERLVEEVLISLGIGYLEQGTFIGMEYKKQLYYDFLIEDYDAIIEYQGKQHYQPVDYLGGFKKFCSQLKRDEIKAKFAEDNGYKLIEVPYNLDTYTKILDYLNKELLA